MSHAEPNEETPISAVPKEKGLNFSLLDQLVFYGSYHNNPYNQIVHFIFVPCIWISVAIWLCYTGEFATHPAKDGALGRYISLNGAFIGWLLYAIYYVILAPVAGVSGLSFIMFLTCFQLTYDVVLFFFYIFANWVYQTAGVKYAWVVGLIMHIIGWYMQIHVGHIIFEKRRAALLDSFFQSLVSAPLFTWFELLFFLGFYKDLHLNMKDRVGSNILDYKKSLAAGKV
jgi:uncharacterized membrane protein YGL010W